MIILSILNYIANRIFLYDKLHRIVSCTFHGYFEWFMQGLWVNAGVRRGLFFEDLLQIIGIIARKKMVCPVN